MSDERVAPFTGAWIEMSKRALKQLTEARSHPSRVRGLKYMQHLFYSYIIRVAPFTGAWIEILPKIRSLPQNSPVAPFTGAWIEMLVRPNCWPKIVRSHPSRVRGLKYTVQQARLRSLLVAPFTGAWIEM